MDKKIFSLLLAVIIIVIAISAGYLMDNPNVSDESFQKMELNVSSEGPNNLSNLIEDIETASYYKGHDNETLEWMKSLGDKSVFYSGDYIVIMDLDDAGKLRSEYATDVSITEFFECKVLQNRSMGDVKYPKDILLVEDVEYLHENITYFDV